MTANADVRLPLPALLTAQRDCTRQLLTTLQAEHQALIGNDVAALEQITRSKSEASDRLAALGHQLESLRADARAATIDALIAAREPSGIAARCWQEIAGLAAQCLQANRDNATLLNAREQQIRSALQLLYPTASAQTYGRGGYAGLQNGSRSLGLA